MADRNSPVWLLEYRANRYSQTGEDGVLAKALEMLPERDGWCVDVGAGDGETFSNTLALIEDGYSAVLIEPDRRQFARLAGAYAGSDRVIALRRAAGWGEDDGLDAILAATPAPAEFDVLSIDIDGNDYHVWAAMARYRPKLVLIEFNPTIPTRMQFVQPADPGVSRGNSLLSLTELGREKGYELISVFPWNALFVRAEFFPLFGIACNMPALLRRYAALLTVVFVGYDGTVFSEGNTVMPWHPGLRLDPGRMQMLPRWLRQPAEKYNWAQRWGYRALMAWRRA